jgi:hypothetical protein
MVINSTTFLIPIIFFIFLIILHIIILKFFNVTKEALLFFSIYTIGIVVICFSNIEMNEKSLIIFLYLSIIIAFIQTYPAIRRVIPSFQILLLISSYNKMKVPINDSIILNELSHQNSIEIKIAELINDKFIKNIDGSLVLSNSGYFLIKIFQFYRKALGLKDGGG